MPKIHSIGHRLFLSTALILLTTIAATLLFGSSLIERYYVHNKEVELKHAYQSFSLAFNRNEKLPARFCTMRKSAISTSCFLP